MKNRKVVYGIEYPWRSRSSSDHDFFEMYRASYSRMIGWARYLRLRDNLNTITLPQLLAHMVKHPVPAEESFPFNRDAITYWAIYDQTLAHQQSWLDAAKIGVELNHAYDLHFYSSLVDLTSRDHPVRGLYLIQIGATGPWMPWWDHYKNYGWNREISAYGMTHEDFQSKTPTNVLPISDEPAVPEMGRSAAHRFRVIEGGQGVTLRPFAFQPVDPRLIVPPAASYRISPGRY